MSKSLYTTAMESVNKQRATFELKLKEEAAKKEAELLKEKLKWKETNVFKYQELSEFTKISKTDFEIIKKRSEVVLLVLSRAKNQKIQPVIKKGDALALFDMGRCYSYGIHIEKNPQKAIVCYQAASNLGFVPAHYNLALCIIEKEPERAVDLLRLAAEVGHASAQNNLATCFLRNLGVEPSSKNLKSAYYLFEKAYIKRKDDKTKKGLEECLAFFKEYWIPLPKHPQFELSFDDKISDTAYATEKKYAEEFEYTKFDDLKTLVKDQFSSLKALADSNKNIERDPLALPRAKFDIAQCYFEGLFVPKDVKIGAKYCSEAMKLKYIPAQNLLGEAYYKVAKKLMILKDVQKEDIQKNTQKAYEHFTQAAEKGFAEAQYNLAVLYMDKVLMAIIGLQNDKIPNLAFTWLMRAALNGYQPAEKLVLECHQKNYSGIPNALKNKMYLQKQKEAAKNDAPKAPNVASAANVASAPNVDSTAHRDKRIKI